MNGPGEPISLERLLEHTAWLKTLARGLVSRAARAAAVITFLAAGAAAPGCRNFHVVDPGKCYRSGQLKGRDLVTTIEKHGIKTIINLRGAHPGEEWYDHEVRVGRERGVQRVDIPMSSHRLPHRRDLLKLLDAFREAPRPLLIHCKAGADRTGEACAIYALEYMGRSRDEALEMLSPAYLHFPSRRPAKRYFIDRVYRGREWAYRDYDPCRDGYEHYDPSKYCRAGEPDFEPPPDDDDTAGS